MTKKDWLVHMWVGKRVISVSNAFQTDPDNPSLCTGVVIDIAEVTMAKNLTPILKLDDSSEVVMSFSNIMEYTDALWGALNKLTASERWTVITAFAMRFHE